MRNWVTIGLVAIGSLAVAGAAVADVPSSLTSDVVCSCSADVASGGASGALPLNCTISPSGGFGGTDPSDNINVAVIVRNVLSVPLAGSSVVVASAPIGGAVFAFDDGVAPPEADEDPQTAVSALDGSANFVFDEGGVVTAAGAANLDFSVTASGPGPGGPVVLDDCDPDLYVLGYNLDALDAEVPPDNDVDVVDFAIFASLFGLGPNRGDFNHSGGLTGVVDFALFAANFNADIGNQ